LEKEEEKEEVLYGIVAKFEIFYDVEYLKAIVFNFKFPVNV
jgi:hypothetical protein